MASQSTINVLKPSLLVRSTLVITHCVRGRRARIGSFSGKSEVFLYAYWSREKCSVERLIVKSLANLEYSSGQ